MDRSEGEGRGHRPRTPARVGGKPCVASRRNVTPKRGAPGSRTTVSRADRKTGRAKPGGIFGGAGNSWPSRRARSVTPKRGAPGSTALTSCRLCPTVTGGSRPGPFPGGSGVVPPPRTQGTFTICVPLWVPPLRVLLRRCHFNGVTISPKAGPVKGMRRLLPGDIFLLTGPLRLDQNAVGFCIFPFLQGIDTVGADIEQHMIQFLIQVLHVSHPHIRATSYISIVNLIFLFSSQNPANSMFMLPQFFICLTYGGAG